jgi:hypothetical protein
VTDLDPGWTPRQLTESEREEIRHAAARLRGFPPVLGLMTLMIGFVLLRALGAGRTPVAFLIAAFGAVVLATAWRRWLRARDRGVQLLADADVGWAARGSAEHEGLEVLPVSRARWTEGGEPAAWRARVARRR